MVRTILRSRSAEVVIGPDQPFVLIGERINPTGRKTLADEILAGNLDRVRRDAAAQVEAGAAMLDVNAGIGGADESHLLPMLVREIQNFVDIPLSIDSSVSAALTATLPVCEGKPLVNSVTGEEERLEAILP
ncbi:MAG: dihydropteroate synthase, partial [Acidobacteriota bacterium]|nr:dihydropteroate synthase [Acidobacteriota bacterium]